MQSLAAKCPQFTHVTILILRTREESSAVLPLLPMQLCQKMHSVSSSVGRGEISRLGRGKGKFFSL